MNRVVITGLGIHSCLGTNSEEVTASLREGRSGVIFDPIRKEMGFRSALIGNVPMPDLKAELGRKERKNMPEEAMYAFASTKQALAHAGMTQEFIDANEVGILFGNDSTAGAVIEGVDILREKKDTMLIGSGNIFQSMNCTVTMNLSTIFKLKGVNFTVSAACASGSHSIGMGYLLIKMGSEPSLFKKTNPPKHPSHSIRTEMDWCQAVVLQPSFSKASKVPKHVEQTSWPNSLATASVPMANTFPTPMSMGNSAPSPWPWKWAR
jgi:hypothetical protein